jgi:mono/diheme cytochrome c family protein
MNISGRTIMRILVFLLVALILPACDRQKNMRGYDFIPDMVYSRAYETYSKNPNFKDSVTMRVPVTGTVSIGSTPFHYTIDSLSWVKAGNELINPYLPTDEVLARGKFIFTTFCIGCHGALAKGDGQLYSSGLYPLKPKDLTAEAIIKVKDGQIYHTITLGFGSMMPHGAQIRPEDRWKLVLYVRTLQKRALMARDTIAAGKIK